MSQIATWTGVGAMTMTALSVAVSFTYHLAGKIREGQMAEVHAIGWAIVAGIFWIVAK